MLGSPLIFRPGGDNVSFEMKLWFLLTLRQITATADGLLYQSKGSSTWLKVYFPQTAYCDSISCGTQWSSTPFHQPFILKTTWSSRAFCVFCCCWWVFTFQNEFCGISWGYSVIMPPSYPLQLLLASMAKKKSFLAPVTYFTHRAARGLGVWQLCKW